MRKWPIQVKDLILFLQREMKSTDGIWWLSLITDETPIIFSRDDKGGSYQWCRFNPTIMYSRIRPGYCTRYGPEDILDAKEVTYPLKDSILPVLCIN
jgi:hypothetical protein